MAPLVSIIVPTRNSEKFLDKCLASIKKQTYKKIEIIVVDRDSEDKTKVIARKYTNNIFNIGPERSAQKNFGAKKASGEFVYMVDSDFILDPQVVEQCLSKIKDGYDAIVVHNTPDPSVSWIAKIRKFEVDMYKYDLTYSAARFFRKEIFLAVSGYNKKITAGEDYDIQNRLNRSGYKTGFIEAEAIHLGEPTSFLKHLKRYYEYGKDFVFYQRENKEEAKVQLGFVRPVYLKHWRRFLRHPLLGLGFIFYNFFKFGAGGLGFTVGKLKRRLK